MIDEVTKHLSCKYPVFGKILYSVLSPISNLLFCINNLSLSSVWVILHSSTSPFVWLNRCFFKVLILLYGRLAVRWKLQKLDFRASHSRLKLSGNLELICITMFFHICIWTTFIFFSNLPSYAIFAFFMSFAVRMASRKHGCSLTKRNMVQFRNL